MMKQSSAQNINIVSTLKTQNKFIKAQKNKNKKSLQKDPISSTPFPAEIEHHHSLKASLLYRKPS